MRGHISILIITVIGRDGGAAFPCEVSRFGLEELGSEVCGRSVGIAALPSFSILELSVRGQETLMISRATQRLFAAGLFLRQLPFVEQTLSLRRIDMLLTGSKVGL